MKREAMIALNKAVMEMYNEDRIPVIIVDEAHLLKDNMLEEIRFMINFNMDSMSPLSPILVGQTELKEKLKLKSMEAISQRVTVKFHLDGLTRPGTEDYILTHLKTAKGDKYADMRIMDILDSTI